MASKNRLKHAPVASQAKLAQDDLAQDQLPQTKMPVIYLLSKP